MDRLTTDILVVGSGPAGSTVARYAAEKGVQVTFIERRHEVGVPVRCGEFLPDVDEIRTMFPLADDLEGTFDLPSGMKLVETDRIRLVNPKNKATDIPMNGYTIDRDRYDQYLADEAIRSGATLIKDCLFKNIDGNKAITSQGEIEYKVIIGADGPGSRVARSLGLQRNHR
ncbi:MAG: NAD(P)/FAD-dependent oxidoreductase, partial [Methanomassiliicoccales archaeon]|nr:NAD(P)/FAD-dependent oxidoreductase [Methanomassiliicoccales archaeon]